MPSSSDFCHPRKNLKLIWPISCISATKLSATFCLANILNAMAFPLDKQADFITISWQNKIKKKYLWCESPVDNFGDRNRPVAIWLYIFMIQKRKLVESVDNLYKYKIQQANGLYTVYSGTTHHVYSDNGQGVCFRVVCLLTLPHVPSL